MAVVAPHPDDEIIGAPGLITDLVHSGCEVTVILASLGRREQHERRRAEALLAAERGGWELRVMEPALAISLGDDRDLAQRELSSHLCELSGGLGSDVLWVAPSPHDLHHGHEVVGRAVVDAIETRGRGTCCLWGLWGELPFPTLYVPFGTPQLELALHVLDAYAGEVDRVDCRTLLKGRAMSAVALGSERIFGFGARTASDEPYADVLCEVTFTEGRWLLGTPRVWNRDPARAAAPEEEITWWLHDTSVRDRRAYRQPDQIRNPGP